MWETQAIGYLQCIMKRHRPLQREDRLFFACHCLFSNSSFHWLSFFQAHSRSQTEKRQHAYFFVPWLSFPSFCPSTNRVVWKTRKVTTLHIISTAPVDWTPATVVTKPTKWRPRCVFLSSALCKNLVFVNKFQTFCRNAKSFYLAVTNIPFGFCLKLHPTDKSRRKRLFFFSLNTIPHLPTPTFQKKRTSQSNQSWRTNSWFTLI